MQGGRLGGAQPPCRAQRGEAAAEEDLVGVDVAHPGEAALVQQQRLERPGRAPADRLQPGQRQLERVHAQALAAGELRRLPLGHPLQAPELAHVPVDQPAGAARQEQLQVHVPVRRPGRRVRGAGELAGHAQVDHDHPLPVEAQEEVLPVPADPLHPLAGDPAGEEAGAAGHDRRVVAADGGDDRPDQALPQPAGHGLDFGQLGHRLQPLRVLSRAGSRRDSTARRPSSPTSWWVTKRTQPSSGG